MVEWPHMFLKMLMVIDMKYRQFIRISNTTSIYVNIPMSIVRRLGIREGDMAEVHEKDGKIIITPMRSKNLKESRR